MGAIGSGRQSMLWPGGEVSNGMGLRLHSNAFNDGEASAVFSVQNSVAKNLFFFGHDLTVSPTDICFM